MNNECKLAHIEPESYQIYIEGGIAILLFTVTLGWFIKASRSDCHELFSFRLFIGFFMLISMISKCVNTLVPFSCIGENSVVLMKVSILASLDRFILALLFLFLNKTMLIELIRVKENVKKVKVMRNRTQILYATFCVTAAVIFTLLTYLVFNEDVDPYIIFTYYSSWANIHVDLAFSLLILPNSYMAVHSYRQLNGCNMDFSQKYMTKRTMIGIISLYLLFILYIIWDLSTFLNANMFVIYFPLLHNEDKSAFFGFYICWKLLTDFAPHLGYLLVFRYFHNFMYKYNNIMDGDNMINIINAEEHDFIH
eukprot:TRINITY_DN2203_c0_g1_i1.p1 TRINITY_DN2203_c0_g1~~TRINITY_DN2203_c0_g1_i1.p1  ORF type:complete len:309 (-),score=15.01 TRINITY_DN2203_c0_g1_i1:66-992(-)